MRGLRAVLCAAGVVVVACNAPKEPAQPSSIESARAELDAWWRQYETAVKAGDVATLGPMHADSVYLVEPGAPTLHGRAAVVGFLSEAFKSVQYVEVSIRPEQSEWVGDRVFQVGSYNDRFEVQGQSQASYGRFAGLFQRDSVGHWQVLRAVVALDSAVPRPAAK